VGGESIEECQENVRILEKYKVKAILDYSVEGKESEDDIKAALIETLKSIKNAGKDKNIPFAVFKPTAFTTPDVLEKVSAGKSLTDEETQEAEQFRRRIETLCKSAYENDIPILIDAEDSWFQNFIGKSAVVFVWAAIPYKTEWRYSLVAYKDIMIEAGHICQNLYLACEGIGAGTCAIAAYEQKVIDELIQVDGENEMTVYVSPVGKIKRK